MPRPLTVACIPTYYEMTSPLFVCLYGVMVIVSVLLQACADGALSLSLSLRVEKVYDPTLASTAWKRTFDRIRVWRSTAKGEMRSRDQVFWASHIRRQQPPEATSPPPEHLLEPVDRSEISSPAYVRDVTCSVRPSNK